MSLPPRDPKKRHERPNPGRPAQEEPIPEPGEERAPDTPEEIDED